MHELGQGDVAPRVGEVAVVGEGVEHWAGGAVCIFFFLLVFDGMGGRGRRRGRGGKVVSYGRQVQVSAMNGPLYLRFSP